MKGLFNTIAHKTQTLKTEWIGGKNICFQFKLKLKTQDKYSEWDQILQNENIHTKTKFWKNAINNIFGNTLQ